MNEYENENVGERFDLFNDFTHEILGNNSYRLPDIYSSNTNKRLGQE